MVLIHLKSTNTNTNNNGNDDTSFMYETTTSTKVDELIKSLVEIHNSKTGESLNAEDVLVPLLDCIGVDDDITSN